MESEMHRQKAERLASSVSRCPLSDYETVIEGALLAAGHWFNLALHEMDFYPPSRDVLHLTKLPMEDYFRIQAVAGDLLRAFDELEELRSPYVRGNEPHGEAAAARSLELLGDIRRMAASVRPHEIALPANWNARAVKK